MYSSRFEWSLEPNELSQLLASKRGAGTRILDLTESNPTRAGLPYSPDIAAALADPRALLYEPTPWGLDIARQAVAGLHGVDIKRVMLTASTSESYSYLFKLLCSPGDRVLVPQPSYPLFEFLAKLECVDQQPYPLVYTDRWEIDFDALEAAVNNRTRAVFVVNPNNPSGSFLQKPELARLVDFAARHRLAIVSDEVFSAYGFGEDPARVETLAGINEVPVFCLNGLSKLAGMPQMKAGWIVMHAPEELRERLELIADTFLSVSTPVQWALPRLLEYGDQVRAAIRTRTAANLAWLQNAGNPLKTEGGWYAILPLAPGTDEGELVLQLLEEHNVLIQPGFFYDFADEGYAVVSLLTRESEFQTGITVLDPYLRREPGDRRV